MFFINYSILHIIITSVFDKELEVSVMTKHNTYHTWPDVLLGKKATTDDVRWRQNIGTGLGIVHVYSVYSKCLIHVKLF